MRRLATALLVLLLAFTVAASDALGARHDPEPPKETVRFPLPVREPGERPLLEPPGSNPLANDAKPPAHSRHRFVADALRPATALQDAQNKDLREAGLLHVSEPEMGSKADGLHPAAASRALQQAIPLFAGLSDCATVASGLNVRFSSPCVLRNGTYTFGDATIEAGVSVFVEGTVNVTANSLVLGVGAMLDGTGTATTPYGYTPVMGEGGCHGGCPASLSPGVSGFPIGVLSLAPFPNVSSSGVFGSLLTPFTPGNRGGPGRSVSNAPLPLYGNGGAALFLNLSGPLILSSASAIRVDGGNVTVQSNYTATAAFQGGAGAGGSLYVIASNITVLGRNQTGFVTPVLSARGGSVSSTSPTVSSTSVLGGGGRIAVVCPGCSAASWAVIVTTRRPPAFPSLTTPGAGTSVLTLNGSTIVIIEGLTGDSVTGPLYPHPSPGTPWRVDEVWTVGNPNLILTARPASNAIFELAGPFSRAPWDRSVSATPPKLVLETPGTALLLSHDQSALTGSAAASYAAALAAYNVSTSDAPCPVPLKDAPLFVLPAALDCSVGGRVAFPAPVTLALPSQATTLATTGTFTNVTNIFFQASSRVSLDGVHRYSCIRTERSTPQFANRGPLSLVVDSLVWRGSNLALNSGPTEINATVEVVIDCPSSCYSFARERFDIAAPRVVLGRTLLVQTNGAMLQVGSWPGAWPGGAAAAGCGGESTTLNISSTLGVCRNNSLWSFISPASPRAYGSAVAPVLAGSTGRYPSGSGVTNAGITMRIIAGELTLNATLDVGAPPNAASTQAAVWPNFLFSGSSGGSLFISATLLKYSSGRLLSGGAIPQFPAAGFANTAPSGGGAAGRIALHLGSTEFLPSLPISAWPLSMAAWGANSSDGVSIGAGGTIYVRIASPPRAALVVSQDAGALAAGRQAQETFLFDPVASLLGPAQTLSELVLPAGVTLLHVVSSNESLPSVDRLTLGRGASYIVARSLDANVVVGPAALNATTTVISGPALPYVASPPCLPAGSATSELIVLGSCVFEGAYTFATLTVGPSARLFIRGKTTIQATTVSLSAGAVIDGTGRGITPDAAAAVPEPGTGGCHAGCPHSIVNDRVSSFSSIVFDARNLLAASWPYGDITRPTEVGSRGGNGTYLESLENTAPSFGWGGAALFVTAKEISLGVGARIEVDGGSPVVSAQLAGPLAQEGGCGAGGSIYLETDVLIIRSATGTPIAAPLPPSLRPLLSARGGVAPNTTGLAGVSSTGGGGRIAVYCYTCSNWTTYKTLLAVALAPPIVGGGVTTAAGGVAYIYLGGLAIPVDTTIIVESDAPSRYYPVICTIPIQSRTINTIEARGAAPRVVLSSTTFFDPIRAPYLTGPNGGVTSSYSSATISLTIGTLSMVPAGVDPGYLFVDLSVRLTLKGDEQPAYYAAAVPPLNASYLSALPPGFPMCSGTSAPLYVMPYGLELVESITFAPRRVLYLRSLQLVKIPAPWPLVGVEALLLSADAQAGSGAVTLPTPDAGVRCLWSSGVPLYQGGGYSVSFSLLHLVNAELTLPTITTVTVGSLSLSGTASMRVSLGARIAATNFSLGPAAEISVDYGRSDARAGSPIYNDTLIAAAAAGCGARIASLPSPCLSWFTRPVDAANAPRPFGSAISPAEPGGGTQSGRRARPGGGGALTLQLGTAVINGSILVDASPEPDDEVIFGALVAPTSGSAGGSVAVSVTYLAHCNGIISVRGAAGRRLRTGVESTITAGGSAGRVSLIVQATGFDASLSPFDWPLRVLTDGGVSNEVPTRSAGAAGTYYVRLGNASYIRAQQRVPASAPAFHTDVTSADTYVFDEFGLLADGGVFEEVRVGGGAAVFFFRNLSKPETTVAFTVRARTLVTGGGTANVLAWVDPSTVSVYDVSADRIMTIPAVTDPAPFSGLGVAGALPAPDTAASPRPPGIPDCPRALTPVDVVFAGSCMLRTGSYTFKDVVIEAGTTVYIDAAVNITARSLTLRPGGGLDGTGAGGVSFIPATAASAPTGTTLRPGYGGCHASCHLDAFGGSAAVSNVQLLEAFPASGFRFDGNATGTPRADMPYGSLLRPLRAGSRGDYGRTALNGVADHWGAGGAALQINLAGNLTLSPGSFIVMDGEAARSRVVGAALPYMVGGSGAGGSIFVTVGGVISVLASGNSTSSLPVFSVRGGAPVAGPSASPIAGAGSGGRIAIICPLCARRSGGLPLDFRLRSPATTSQAAGGSGLAVQRLGDALYLTLEAVHRLQPMSLPVYGLPRGPDGRVVITEIIVLASPPSNPFAASTTYGELTLLNRDAPAGSGSTGGQPNIVIEALTSRVSTTRVIFTAEPSVTLLPPVPPAVPLPPPLAALFAHLPSCAPAGDPVVLFNRTGFILYSSASVQLPNGSHVAFYDTDVAWAGSMYIPNAFPVVIRKLDVIRSTLTGLDTQFMRGCVRVSDSTLTLAGASSWSLSLTGLFVNTSTVNLALPDRPRDLTITVSNNATFLGPSTINLALNTTLSVADSLFIGANVNVIGVGSVNDTAAAVGTPNGALNEGAAHAGCGDAGTVAGRADLNAACTNRTVSRAAGGAVAYSLVTAPRLPGSRGPGSPSSVHTLPGGAFIATAGRAKVDGVITLAGRASMSVLTGGASGGAFALDAGFLDASTGLIDVSGGNAALGGSSLGGGSGGRIAVRVNLTAFSGPPSSWPLRLRAAAGRGNTLTTGGAAGSIFIALAGALHLWAIDEDALINPLSRPLPPTIVLDSLDDFAASSGSSGAALLTELRVLGGASLLFAPPGGTNASSLIPVQTIATDQPLLSPVRVASNGTIAPLQPGSTVYEALPGAGVALCPATTAALVLRSPCRLLEGTYTFSRLVLEPGAVLFVQGIVVIYAGNITLGRGAFINGTGDAATSVSDLKYTTPSGFHGGGCHASCSSAVFEAASMTTNGVLSQVVPPFGDVAGPYGNFRRPRTVGGAGSMAVGAGSDRVGVGGAALELQVVDALTLADGSGILLDGGLPVDFGGPGTAAVTEAGAGAGGSLLVTAGLIKRLPCDAANCSSIGKPLLSAAGGAYQGLPSPAHYGGGGRIALTCDRCSSSLPTDLDVRTTIVPLQPGGTIWMSLAGGTYSYLATDSTYAAPPSLLGTAVQPVVLGFDARNFTVDELSLTPGAVLAFTPQGSDVAIDALQVTIRAITTPLGSLVPPSLWSFGGAVNFTLLQPPDAADVDSFLSSYFTAASASTPVCAPPAPVVPFVLRASIKCKDNNCSVVLPLSTANTVVTAPGVYARLPGLQPSTQLWLAPASTVAVATGLLVCDCVRIKPNATLALGAAVGTNVAELATQGLELDGGSVQPLGASVRLLSVSVSGNAVAARGASVLLPLYSDFRIAGNFTLGHGARLASVDPSVRAREASQLTPASPRLGGAHVGCGAVLRDSSVDDGSRCLLNTRTNVAPRAWLGPSSGISPGGSGGASDQLGAPGAGGVAISITVDGTATLNGTIDASGFSTVRDSSATGMLDSMPGAGAGGAIDIDVGRLEASSGTVDVRGGSVVNFAPLRSMAAGGSGGYIRLSANSSALPESLPPTQWPLRFILDGGLSNDDATAGATGMLDMTLPGVRYRIVSETGAATRDRSPSLVVYDATSAATLINNSAPVPLIPKVSIVTGGAVLLFSVPLGSAGDEALLPPPGTPIIAGTRQVIDGITLPPTVEFTTAGAPLTSRPQLPHKELVFISPSSPSMPCPVAPTVPLVTIASSCVWTNGVFIYQSLTIAPYTSVYVRGAVNITARGNVSLGDGVRILSAGSLALPGDDSSSPDNAGTGGCHASCPISDAYTPSADIPVYAANYSGLQWQPYGDFASPTQPGAPGRLGRQSSATADRLPPVLNYGKGGAAFVLFLFTGTLTFGADVEIVMDGHPPPLDVNTTGIDVLGGAGAGGAVYIRTYDALFSAGGSTPRISAAGGVIKGAADAGLRVNRWSSGGGGRIRVYCARCAVSAMPQLFNVTTCASTAPDLPGTVPSPCGITILTGTGSVHSFVIESIADTGIYAAPVAFWNAGTHVTVDAVVFRGVRPVFAWASKGGADAPPANLTIMSFNVSAGTSEATLLVRKGGSVVLHEGTQPRNSFAVVSAALAKEADALSAVPFTLTPFFVVPVHITVVYKGDVVFGTVAPSASSRDQLVIVAGKTFEGSSMPLQPCTLLLTAGATLDLTVPDKLVSIIAGTNSTITHSTVASGV